MKVIDMSAMRNVINENRKPDPNKIVTKGRKFVDDDYLSHAMGTLDALVERTKQESIAYSRWRDSVNKDLELKAQYMGEDELINDQVQSYQDDWNNIYGILDKDVDDFSTVKADRSRAQDVPANIKNYREGQINSNNIPDNTNSGVQNYTPPTNNIIYEFDEED